MFVAVENDPNNLVESVYEEEESLKYINPQMRREQEMINGTNLNNSDETHTESAKLESVRQSFLSQGQSVALTSRKGSTWLEETASDLDMKESCFSHNSNSYL